PRPKELRQTLWIASRGGRLTLGLTKPGGQPGSWEVSLLIAWSRNGEQICAPLHRLSTAIHQILWLSFRANARCGRLCKLWTCELLVWSRCSRFFSVQISRPSSRLARHYACSASCRRPLRAICP